jgi:hypothetical protein
MLSGGDSLENERGMCVRGRGHDHGVGIRARQRVSERCTGIRNPDARRPVSRPRSIASHERDDVEASAPKGLHVGLAPETCAEDQRSKPHVSDGIPSDIQRQYRVPFSCHADIQALEEVVLPAEVEPQWAAILQPPKPTIAPPARIVERAAEHDVEPEAGS